MHRRLFLVCKLCLVPYLTSLLFPLCFPAVPLCVLFPQESLRCFESSQSTSAKEIESLQSDRNFWRKKAESLKHIVQAAEKKDADMDHLATPEPSPSPSSSFCRLRCLRCCVRDGSALGF